MSANEPIVFFEIIKPREPEPDETPRMMNPAGMAALLDVMKPRRAPPAPPAPYCEEAAHMPQFEIDDLD